MQYDFIFHTHLDTWHDLHIFIHIHKSIHTYIYIYIYIHTFLHTYSNVHIYIHIIYSQLCLKIHIYTCLYLNLGVISVIYLHTHIHMFWYPLDDSVARKETSNVLPKTSHTREGLLPKDDVYDRRCWCHLWWSWWRRRRGWI